MSLTPRQEAFCREYLIDLNAKQAAIRAGYSEKGAEVQGCKLLTIPKVAEFISQAKAKRSERTQIDADYVLNRLAEIDRMDFADIFAEDGQSLLPIREWPESWRRYISGFDFSEIWEGYGEEREMTGLLKKIKWPDKVRNLELLGKHVLVQAFREQVHSTGEISLTISQDDAAL